MLSRRDVVKAAIYANALSALALTEGQAQTSGAPLLGNLSASDGRLFRAIEDLPWISAGGPSEYPVYVLYAPWCPVCKQFTQDLEDKKISPNVEFGWIGCSPQNANESLLISTAVKNRDYSVIKTGFLKGAPAFNALPQNYIERCISPGLIGLIKRIAFPFFIYEDGGRIVYRSGAAPDQSGRWGSATPRANASFIPRTIQSLEDRWVDDGAVAGGQFSSKEKEWQIFSLPYEFSLPFSTMEKQKNAAAQRYIRVNNQRWVELDHVFGSSRLSYNSYIKV